MKGYLPKNKMEYLQLLSLVMIENFCNPTNFDCVREMLDLTVGLVSGPQSGATNGFEHITMNILPEGFDTQVIQSLEDLFSVFRLLNWIKAQKLS